MRRIAIRHVLLPGLLTVYALMTVGCSSAPVKHQTGSAAPYSPAQPPTLSATRHDVVSQAHEFLGTPYRYGGNQPGGFDCSGLVQYTHAQAGVQVPRVARAQRRHARPVSLSRIKPGDLLFFELEGKNDHVGVYVGQGEFIHAPSSGKRVSRARLDSVYWKPRLIGAGSYLSAE